MGMPSATELLIVLGIVVLIFGGKKIPELMKGIGSGIKNFKNAVKEDDVAKADVEKTEQVTASVKSESTEKPKETTKKA